MIRTRKQRQADATADVEALFKSLRENRPVSLTHRQAVSLSGRLYRSWASDLENDTQISMVHTEDGWQREYGNFAPREMEAVYVSALAHLDRFDDVEAEKLEKIVGPLVNRLLQDAGITPVDQATRYVLLPKFIKALRQGMEVRRRKAAGDYSPDANSECFPE